MATIYENNITAGVEVLRAEAGDRWRVPEVLLSRTVEYFKQHAPRIREHLTKTAEFWALDTSTQNVLLEDYARALFGVFDFKATRGQMEQLRALQSARPFFIDRYGLFYAVLGGYKGIIVQADEHDRITAPREKYKGPEAQQDAQQAYLNGPDYTEQGRAIMYLIRWEQFDAETFAGGFGPEAVNGFLDRCKQLGAVYDYAEYYLLCKYCLNATREELDLIPAPLELFGKRTPQQFAEDVAERQRERLDNVENLLARVIEEPAPRELVKVPETFAGILSRDVYGRVGYDKKQLNENDILPIQAFIADYMEKHRDETATTTPRIIEKTIEGVNMLQRIYTVKPEGGWYTYETTVTRFATLCGYTNPNEDEIKGVILALLVLRGLYLAVWKQDGIHAVNVLNVPDIGMTGKARGKIRIQVNTEATAGKPQLLAQSDFDRMRKEAKGRAENHFRYQIIGKGHKNENDLLDEIFGYTNDMREAEQSGATVETLTGLRRNQQKNKPRDRKRLQKMFEREQAAGFLTFEKYTNGKGETVYKWKRKTPPTPQEQ